MPAAPLGPGLPVGMAVSICTYLFLRSSQGCMKQMEHQFKLNANGHIEVSVMN